MGGVSSERDLWLALTYTLVSAGSLDNQYPRSVGCKRWWRVGMLERRKKGREGLPISRRIFRFVVEWIDLNDGAMIMNWFINGWAASEEDQDLYFLPCYSLYWKEMI
jgi:hypothetical protein